MFLISVVEFQRSVTINPIRVYLNAIEGVTKHPEGKNGTYSTPKGGTGTPLF